MREPLTPAGLKRRLKRHLLRETQVFFATTTPGFEGALLAEVRAQPDATIVGQVTGGVAFGGPLELMYHAAAGLRTANGLIMRIAEFTVRSYPELFDKVGRIPVELYVGFADSIAVEASATASRLHHTGNIEKSVFEAFAGRLASYGLAPQRRDGASLRFLVRLCDDSCTLSIDAGGPLLYKRGYRLAIARAPLRESIAAGLLMLADWEKFPVIADPLCGSGTLIIEAALLALGIKPGANRTCAFQAWPCFNESLWNRIRNEPPGVRARPVPTLVGSDLGDRAVAAAVANAERAGVAACVSFSSGNCLEFNNEGTFGHRGLVIANLPYGKRVGVAGAEGREWPRRFGRQLRRACRGWAWAFVTEDRHFAKSAGLTAGGCMPFINGGLDVYFVTGTID
jgi:putative N6-adenine-specific DNA methylase